MRRLWHQVQLIVVMIHADYHTGFERLKDKYWHDRV